MPSTSPDTFPLATEPSDWPMPDTTYWNNFSFTSTSTTSSPGQPGQATATQPASLPSVWSLREAVVARTGCCTSRDGTARVDRSAGCFDVAGLGHCLSGRGRVDRRGAHTHPRGVAVDESVHPRGFRRRCAEGTGRRSRRDRAPPHLRSRINLRPRRRRSPRSPNQSQSRWNDQSSSTDWERCRSTGRPVPVGPPPVQTSATQITLEHMIVTIDRSSWWQNDWLVDPEWYVPDTPQGKFPRRSARHEPGVGAPGRADSRPKPHADRFLVLTGHHRS